MSAAPSLFRLFDPSSLDESRNDPQLTLRQAYQKFHLPELDDHAPNTLAEYETQLRHWERRTGNPPIAEITDDTLTALKRSFRAEDYAPATVGKAWRTLSPIFHTLHRRGLIERVPRTKLPKVELGEPRVISYAHLSALYAACDVVRIRCGPARGWRGPAIFRAVIVLCFNTGLRFEDLWNPEWTAFDLDRGGMTLRIKKTKRTIVRPLHKIVVAHLRTLHDGRAGKVFPLSRSTVIRYWKKIREKAKLPDITFHDLRRTCQTRLDEITMGVGDWMLDHRKRDVGAMYYRNMFRIGKKAVRKMRQPKAFRTVRPDPQRRLPLSD